MSDRLPQPNRQSDADRKSVQTSVNVFSRGMAVMVLMILPGIVGYFLDKWLGTPFFIVVGFIIGMFLAVFGLLVVARRANEEIRKKS